MGKFKVVGTISNLTKKEGKTKKGEDFKIVDFLVTEKGEHPNSVLLSYYSQGDKIKFIDSFLSKAGNGAIVDVEFVMSSREYNGKIYGDNKVWKVDFIQPVDTGKSINSNDDDLPF